ncbi:MAG: hypothetical protein H8E03_01305 [Pelagibacteraceae bacterium]|nr:hypothetical protein [Pelagibacteraceae bacterium]
MKIIESDGDFNEFLELFKSTTPSIYYLFSDNNKHPHNNKISFLYIKMESDYLLPFNHNDCNNLNKRYLELLKTDNKKYVWDTKSLYHIIDFNNMVDINTLYYLKHNKEIDLLSIENDTIKFYKNKFYDIQNLNSAIPLMKQIEFLEKLSDELNLDYSLENEQYNEISNTLFNIENSGLYKTDKLVYTQYNPYTTTGRPSNRFGGTNYAALNKEDGTRKEYISRFGSMGRLIEFDYDAYHLRLIGDVIGYEFPPGPVHQHMADIYGVDYKEAKILSFQYLYGGIPTKVVNKIDFFKQTKKLIDTLWERYKKNNYLNTDIYNRSIFDNNMVNMNSNKLFNYYIQSLETEMNMKMLKGLFNTMNQHKSKLALYNYDAFLIDFHSDDGVEYLQILKTEMEQNGRFPVKVAWGKNYHEMNDVTNRFV